MIKSMVAATAALAIAGSSIVYAQQRYARDEGDGGPRFEHHYRPSLEDRKAFADARIAALKAGLALNPDQEKNWPPFEQALRDVVKVHLDRVKAREEREAADGDQQPREPFARLQRHAEAMSQMGAALKRLADAGAPLYQSLNESQQHRFKILAHVLRPHWMRDGFRHRQFGMMNPGDEGEHGMMGPDRGEGEQGMMRHRWDGGRRGVMQRDWSDEDQGGMTAPHGDEEADTL
jgi:hypothetical protein